MTDNDYVATAAAEKRLREVLADRLADVCEEDRGGVTADNLTYILLNGAKIEYKPRTKTVLISLALPDTAKPKTVVDDDSTGSAEYGAPPGAEIAPEGVTATPEPPTPHIVPFSPTFREHYGEEPDEHFD